MTPLAVPLLVSLSESQLNQSHGRYQRLLLRVVDVSECSVCYRLAELHQKLQEALEVHVAPL